MAHNQVLDDVKAELLQTYAVVKTFRMGKNAQSMHELLNVLNLKENRKLSGTRYIENPYSWTIYEGAEFAVMSYNQRHVTDWNNFTLFGKDDIKLDTWVEELIEAEIIKRPRRNRTS